MSFEIRIKCEFIFSFSKLDKNGKKGILFCIRFSLFFCKFSIFVSSYNKKSINFFFLYLLIFFNIDLELFTFRIFSFFISFSEDLLPVVY